MPETLRVGIVGLGYGRRVLLPSFQAHPRCEVVGICGRRADLAREAAAEIGVRAYDSWQSLAGDAHVDTVAIATPSDTHDAIAVGALERGKHVFCEKPLAATLDGARRMAAAASAAGTAHMVGFELPESVEWDRARAILASGTLGRIRYINVTWHLQTYANRLKVASWKTRPADSGGALNEFASHTFHYLELLAGRITAVWCAPIAADAQPASSDDVVVLSLRLESGAVGSVSVCTNAIGGDGHAIRIYGDADTLALVNPTADHACGFRLVGGSHAASPMERDAPPAAGAGIDGRIGAVGRMIDRFAAWALDGRPASPSFAEGLRVQLLLDAAWRSRAEGGWQTVG